MEGLIVCTYGEVSKIFLGQNIAESDTFGSKQNTMFMIFFDTKHRLTDISGFARGNPDFFLHYFGIFYVTVQVSMYKMN